MATEEPDLTGGQRGAGGGSFDDDVGVQTHFKIKAEGLNEVATAIKKIADEWSRLNVAVKGTDVGRMREAMAAMGKPITGGGGAINPGSIPVADPASVRIGAGGGARAGERAERGTSGVEPSENGGGAKFSGFKGEREERGASGQEETGNGGLLKGWSGLAIGGAATAVAAVPGWWAQNQDMNSQLGRYSGMMAQRTMGQTTRNPAISNFADRYLGDEAGFATGRADALATAGMMENQYGPMGGRRSNAALAGQETISRAAMLSGTEGAQVFGELMSPQVTNMLQSIGVEPVRGRGGEIRDVGQVSEDLFSRMRMSGQDLDYNAPGERLHENFKHLGIDPTTTGQTLIEVQRANENLQRLQDEGKLSRAHGRTINAQNVDEYQEAGGVENAYTSRIKFDQERERIATEVFGAGQGHLVQTNDWLAKQTEHLEGILKAVMPLGSHLGTIAREVPVLGTVISDPINSLIAAILLSQRAGAGGGGGFFGGGGGGKGAGGWKGAAKLGAKGLGAAGLGLTAASLVSGIAPDPDDKEAVDWGNVAGYAAGGAAIGSFIPGVGTLAGGAIGGAFGAAREFFGGGAGAGDYVPGEATGDPPDTGSGGTTATMKPLGGGLTAGQALSYIAEENPKRGGSASGPQISNLRPEVSVPMARMMKENPKLSLTSGWRSSVQQESMYRDRYRPPYPGAPLSAPGWKRVKGAITAKPGSSNHEYGLALDIGPASQYGWLFKNAYRHGLTNPFGSSPGTAEDWHWEVPGAKAIRGTEPTTPGSPDAAEEEEGVETEAATAMADPGGGGGGGATSGVNYSVSAALAAALGGSGGGGGSFVGLGGEDVGTARGGGEGDTAGSTSGLGGSASDSELVKVLRQAGFSGEGLKTAYAVVMEESGGRYDVIGPPNTRGKAAGSRDHGLFQINDYYHKAWFKDHDWSDPHQNAAYAFKLSGGGKNWQPWAAYTGPDGKGSDGPWRKHIPAAEAALSGSGGGTQSQSAPPESGDYVGDTYQGGGQSSPSFKGSAGGRSVSVGGGGVQIHAPINIVMKNGSDAEALRAAQTIKEQLSRLSDRDVVRSS